MWRNEGLAMLCPVLQYTCIVVAYPHGVVYSYPWPHCMFCATLYVCAGPFKNYPQVTVYHPPADGSLGHAFANIGWTGWVGSITGFSSVDMAMSEIGVTYPDDTFGKDSRFGVPFTVSYYQSAGGAYLCFMARVDNVILHTSRLSLR